MLSVLHPSDINFKIPTTVTDAKTVLVVILGYDKIEL